MKRFAAVLASTVLVSLIAGCTGPGIEEGMGKGEPSPDFQARLEQQGKLMQTSKYGEKRAADKVKEVEKSPARP